MTRKHYVAIAEVIEKARTQVHLNKQHMETVEKIVADLIEIFSKDNPEFDANRFKKACGVK